MSSAILSPLLRAGGAVAVAVLLSPPLGPSAAPGPGVAYDEIVRVVVNATPPPPGTFDADLAAVTAASPQAVAATPAPRRRGISLSTITSVLTSGSAGNAVTSAAGDVLANSPSSSLQRSLGAQFAAAAAAAQAYLQPHLLHYAYWNGWERVDDLAARTATIRKCDAGQVIRLDLAAKTYRIDDPAADASPSAAPLPQERSGRQADRSAPGTATATLTSTTRALGSLKFGAQTAAGYATTTTFAMTNATGSCRDATASLGTTEYLSNLARPTVASCPIRARPVPLSAAELVTAPGTGGCRPTFSAQRSGPTPPSSRLALYALVTVAGGTGASAQTAPDPSRSIGFLTERGNLKTLSATDAPLFSIPEGFTKAP